MRRVRKDKSRRSLDGWHFKSETTLQRRLLTSTSWLRVLVSRSTTKDNTAEAVHLSSGLTDSWYPIHISRKPCTYPTLRSRGALSAFSPPSLPRELLPSVGQLLVIIVASTPTPAHLDRLVPFFVHLVGLLLGYLGLEIRSAVHVDFLQLVERFPDADGQTGSYGGAQGCCLPHCNKKGSI